MKVHAEKEKGGPKSSRPCRGEKGGGGTCRPAKKKKRELCGLIKGPEKKGVRLEKESLVHPQVGTRRKKALD